jgi:ABC-2 type transport system permease protein
MSSYGAYFRKSFKKNAAYRSSVWLQIPASIVSIGIQVAIWRSVIGEGSADGITLEQMITYAIINSALYAVILTRLYNDVDQRLSTGDIAIDLIRPVRYPGMLLADQLGRAAYRLVFMIIPIVAFAALIFGMQAPASPMAAIGFVVTLPLTMLISYAIGYLIALLAFWFLTTFHFSWTINALVTVFSGSFLPLWFFPDGWDTIARLLPFQFLGFVPAATWMGELTGMELLTTLLSGLFWTVFLLALTAWLWMRATIRLVVQGG